MTKVSVTIEIPIENAELAKSMAEGIFNADTMMGVAYNLSNALAAAAYGALHGAPHNVQCEKLDLMVHLVYETYARLSLYDH